jgi:hypothetical protein
MAKMNSRCAAKRRKRSDERQRTEIKDWDKARQGQDGINVTIEENQG